MVGMGSIGKRHLEIAERIFPEAQIQATSFRRSNLYRSPHDFMVETSNIMKNFGPDLVVIATPSSFHLEVAWTALELGAHLFIEKPISDSTTGVAKLIKTSTKRRQKIIVGYNLRFLKSLVEFRSYLNDLKVGKLLSVRCEVGMYLPYWRPNQDYRDSVSAKKELGGGVVLELSHEIDYLRWIFGEIDWVRATLANQSSLEVNVEDTAFIVLGFLSDTSGSQLICNLNLDFIRQDSTRNCVVIGEEGTLCWDGISGRISILRRGEKKWEILYDNDETIYESYLLEWQHIKLCVENGAEPLVSGIDGLRVLEVIEAIRKSSVNGTQVKVKRNAISIGDFR